MFIRKYSKTMLFFVTITLLQGCGGGSSSNGGDAATAPSVISLSSDVIQPDGTIVIVFNRSMDITSFTLAGVLASESDGGTFSTTTIENDTLTIKPITQWTTTGTNIALTVFGSDAEAIPQALPPLNLTLHIIDFIYYVSSTAKDDSGDGLTPATAKQTINAALSKAAAAAEAVIGTRAAVLVNAGLYEVNSDPNVATHIVLPYLISLFGGYSADFSQRNSILFTSTIEDISSDSGQAVSPNYCIDGSNGHILDGFTIQGSIISTAKYTAAIYNFSSQSSAIIQNNILSGGSGSTASYGMYNSNSTSPTVQNNTLNGGSGSMSYGMYNDNFVNPTVQNNTLNGGSGSMSYGMYNNSSTNPTVQNNTLNGGSGSMSYGMYNGDFSSPTIQNNTLNGGSGSMSYGMYNDNFVNPTVQNNTLLGGSGDMSYAMYNTNTSAKVHNNTLDGGTGSIASYGMYNTNANRSYIVQNNTLSGGSGSMSYGMYNDGANPTVQNNTISGGMGRTISYAMYNINTASPITDNNILFTPSNILGTRYCLYAGIASQLPSIRNNTFAFCDIVYQDSVMGACPLNDDGDNNTTTCTLAEMETFFNLPGNLTVATGNINIDPLFADTNGPDNDITTLVDNDWRLMAASPVDVRQGALDLSNTQSFTTDQDGITRTADISDNPSNVGAAGWSMGAYEFD